MLLWITISGPDTDLKATIWRHLPVYIPNKEYRNRKNLQAETWHQQVKHSIKNEDWRKLSLIGLEPFLPPEGSFESPQKVWYRGHRAEMVSPRTKHWVCNCSSKRPFLRAKGGQTLHLIKPVNNLGHTACSCWFAMKKQHILFFSSSSTKLWVLFACLVCWGFCLPCGHQVRNFLGLAWGWFSRFLILGCHCVWCISLLVDPHTWWGLVRTFSLIFCWVKPFPNSSVFLLLCLDSLCFQWRARVDLNTRVIHECWNHFHDFL